MIYSIQSTRLTEEDIKGGGNTHRPIVSVCPRGTMWKNYGDSPLGIHHYLGSWESYSYRDDSRKNTLRSHEIWKKRSTKKHGGADDELRPWIQGFVRSMGNSLPKTSLFPSLVEKSTQNKALSFFLK